MGFGVHPPSVGKLGLLVSRAGGDADAMINVVDSGPNALGEGLLGLVAGVQDYWQERAVTETKTAASLLSAGGEALAATAWYYDQMERTNAVNLARQDAGYERGYHLPLSAEDVTKPGSAGEFTDATDPARERIIPNPPEEEEVAGENWPQKAEETASRILDQTSVATQVRELCKFIAGFDPFDGIATFVAGDWKLLGQQAKAFRLASRAFGEISDNIDRGRYGIAPKWTGNAADQCQEWLQRCSQCCQGHADFLKIAGDGIMDFAKASYHGFLAIQTQLNLLMDAVTALVATAAAAVAIPLVAAVAQEVGGGDTREAAASLIAAVTLIGKAVNICQVAAHSLVSLGYFFAAEESVNVETWPDYPYRHPERPVIPDD